MEWKVCLIGDSCQTGKEVTAGVLLQSWDESGGFVWRSRSCEDLLLAYLLSSWSGLCVSQCLMEFWGGPKVHMGRKKVSEGIYVEPSSDEVGGRCYSSFCWRINDEVGSSDLEQ